MDKLILGIESSCDETAAAVVKNGREILSNVINTQIDLHKKYGGVVPEIASRKHIQNIDAVVEEALKSANVTIDDIDANDPVFSFLYPYSTTRDKNRDNIRYNLLTDTHYE